MESFSLKISPIIYSPHSHNPTDLSVDEVFSELSEEPLGTASLAQCHRGVLRDSGEVVAVKIQHPDVYKNAFTDLKSMQVRSFTQYYDYYS